MGPAAALGFMFEKVLIPEEVIKAEDRYSDIFEEEKNNLKEPQCVLKVVKILDKNLISRGLVLNSILTSINYKSIWGMSYAEQAKLLKGRNWNEKLFLCFIIQSESRRHRRKTTLQ